MILFPFLHAQFDFFLLHSLFLIFSLHIFHYLIVYIVIAFIIYSGIINITNASFNIIISAVRSPEYNYTHGSVIGDPVLP